ncbi:MAG: Nicotinamide-nucleotide amidohydrolase PncC [Chlamydiia bacterium]|nr:Nicotinamide-nucleotide amidohydrolase PncC [Chlamydiia bacterium]
MIRLQRLFVEKRLTLALAESCTGGLMASILTKIPGSSDYFLGSFVTYSEKLKVSILDVEADLIDKKTAVCKEVAIQMCEGALKKSSSDFAVSVTGDAGPGGDQVGVVYGAIGNASKIYAGRIPNLDGLDREEIQKRACEFLLEKLYRLVKNAEVPFAHK